MPSITGNVCPSFSPTKSQSSKVERNSSSHSLKVAPKATTPLQEAIRPEKVPSSSLSYSACAIARPKYSLKIYCASIATSQFRTIIRLNVQSKLERNDWLEMLCAFHDSATHEATQLKYIR